MKNVLLVLSGPSGVGKGTIVKKLVERGNYALSVSCTTREKREGEAEGKSYFFISKEEFEETAAEGGFLEYSNHFGNYYGTPKKFVEKQLKRRSVILEIDVDGALNVKKAYPQAVLVMILPPDVKTLRARLCGRKTESEDKIKERLERMKYELSKKRYYDYAVVNGDLDVAVAEIEDIVRSLTIE